MSYVKLELILMLMSGSWCKKNQLIFFCEDLVFYIYKIIGAYNEHCQLRYVSSIYVT